MRASPIPISRMEGNREMMIAALLAIRERRVHMVIGARRVLALAADEGIYDDRRSCSWTRRPISSP